MTIQLNTDNHLVVHEEFGEKLNSLLSGELDRFSDQITRLEVHLSDENGQKDGLNDKRCLLEARLGGRQPIAVVEVANTHDLAVSGAIEKLKNTLDSIFGRQKNY